MSNWELSCSSCLALIVTLLSLIYYYVTYTFQYWPRLGVPCIMPRYPIVSSIYEIIFDTKANRIKQLEMYKQFNGKLFCGIYILSKPVMYLLDPAIIQTIFIKHFNKVQNRTINIDTNMDTLCANLFNLEGREWKTVRNTISPAFSSGKLKLMHKQFLIGSDNLIHCMDKFIDTNKSVEVFDLMNKHALDIINDCAFGIQACALSQRNSLFREIEKSFFKPRFLERLQMTIRSQFPKVLSVLRWKVVPRDVDDFIVDLVNFNSSYRLKTNLLRKDLFYFLMKLSNQQSACCDTKRVSTNPDKLIIANTFVFFMAGAITPASCLSYCLYELAENENIQDKAYENIKSVLKKHGGVITFAAINEMMYIKQIICEALRLYPPIEELNRRVSEDYVLLDANITLPKNSMVNVPVYSLHRDEKYFPEPDRFMPERFNEENNIPKGTYLPFGIGPRNCIGERYAKQKMCVTLAKLLLNYRISLDRLKTKWPLVYEDPLLGPPSGIWINFQRRF